MGDNTTGLCWKGVNREIVAVDKCQRGCILALKRSYGDFWWKSSMWYRNIVRISGRGSEQTGDTRYTV